MRQVKHVLLLAAGMGICILQCSDDLSLDVFKGGMVTKSNTIQKTYQFPPYSYRLNADTVYWVFDFAAGKPSTLGIILGGTIGTDSLDADGNPINIGIGQNHIDLMVETHLAAVPGLVSVAINDTGAFLAAVPIASSSLSGFLLPQSSRLFVKIGEGVVDSLPILNPFNKEDK